MPKIPKFKTMKEESEYWDTHSFADYWDELEDVKGPLIDARPVKKLVSIRFDPSLITAAKRVARTKGVGYQTLLRIWAYEGLNRELTESRLTRATVRTTRRPRKAAGRR